MVAHLLEWIFVCKCHVVTLDNLLVAATILAKLGLIGGMKRLQAQIKEVLVTANNVQKFQPHE